MADDLYLWRVLTGEVKILNTSDPAQKISLESQELVSTELCVAPAMEKG